MYSPENHKKKSEFSGLKATVDSQPPERGSPLKIHLVQLGIEYKLQYTMEQFPAFQIGSL